jgi:hypothetical protein
VTTATLDRSTEVVPPIKTEATAQDDGAAVATDELVTVSWVGWARSGGLARHHPTGSRGWANLPGPATSISIMTEANASLFI